jgi:hypothetical protein
MILLSGLVAGLTVVAVTFLAKFGFEYYAHHIGVKSRFLSNKGNPGEVWHREWLSSSLGRRIRKVLLYMGRRDS